MNNPRFEKLKSKALVFYDTGDPSHDASHVSRVLATCTKLGKIEGANLETLLPAALLHDIVNLPKDHPERKQASEMASLRARELLLECDYSSDEIAAISTVITEHSFSRGATASSIESAILQDADRLDALGAIGVMRTVTCGAKMGASYYDEREPFAANRVLDDRAYTIDHFYVKLLKLKDRMNTKSARVIAEERTSFMQIFLLQLKGEIQR